jgi:thioredoxin-like negative regulator of GroEL
MLRQDFPAACKYLESARAQEPNHRGIIKSLGYCYVWSGNSEEAQALLAKIPEAKNELDSYVWWWSAQGRPDLSEKASIMASKLGISSQ